MRRKEIAQAAQRFIRTRANLSCRREVHSTGDYPIADSLIKPTSRTHIANLESMLSTL